MTMTRMKLGIFLGERSQDEDGRGEGAVHFIADILADILNMKTLRSSGKTALLVTQVCSECVFGIVYRSCSN